MSYQPTHDRRFYDLNRPVVKKTAIKVIWFEINPLDSV